MKYHFSIFFHFFLGIFVSSCSLYKPTPPPMSQRLQKTQMLSRTSIQQVSNLRKKVAVLNFFNEAPVGGPDLGFVASEEIKMELSRTREFVLDLHGAKALGDSKTIYSQGGESLQRLSRQAKARGIHFLIFGRVVEARIREKSDEIGLVRKTRSFTQSKVEYRIYDAFLGKEHFMTVVDGYADDQTYRFFAPEREDILTYRQDLLRYGVKVASRKVVPRLLAMATQLEWMGRVAKIEGQRIFINAGRESGVILGDILKVITEGHEIYDPETGALIGMGPGEIKATIEVTDYFGRDGAIAILHSGTSVNEGDYLQLY